MERTALWSSDSSHQSLAQNKAHCPNRELIPHLKHETRGSENRHVQTRGENGEKDSVFAETRNLGRLGEKHANHLSLLLTLTKLKYI